MVEADGQRQAEQKSAQTAKTKRRSVLRIGFIILLAGGIAAGLYFGFVRGHQAGHVAPVEPAVPVTAAVATVRDVPAIIRALGTVEPIETVSVQSRVNGQVMQAFFTQGKEVKKGAPLFLIDPRPYQAALDEAEGQLAHDQAVVAEAKTDLARYQKLAAENSIAKQQATDQAYVVQQDEGTVKVDEANVESAKLNLVYCHIDSPIDGLTGPWLVDPGNYVQAGAGTNLVTITQLHPIFVSFAVPQVDLAAVRRNQTKGALEVEAYSQKGKLLGTGKLTLIDNQVNTATGTIMLEGTFTNQPVKLWPNAYVDVTLVLYMRHNVVTVPIPAVMPGPSGSYVYVIGPGDRVRRVNVEIAARQNGIAVISKGVSAGTRVVTDGQYRLANKVKVAIKPTSGSP